MKDIIEDIKHDDIVQGKREDMMAKLKIHPFEFRRRKYKWKFIFDKNKNLLNPPIFKNIIDIETNQLKQILEDKDYDNSYNYDIILKTIWEEYHYRKNNRK